MFCRRPLASPLLLSIPMRVGVTAWLLTSSACVVPQESRVLQPVPAAQNRPPRIIEEQALVNGSGGRIIYTGSGANCTLEFSLKVSDPDVNDVLLVNWYAYMRSQSGLPIYLQEAIQPDIPPTEIRSQSAIWSIGSIASSPLSQDGTYAVEALVSDGNLDANRRPQPRPDGSTTYVVSYAWVVVVQTGLPCL
jgi:hypothetical protein